MIKRTAAGLESTSNYDFHKKVVEVFNRRVQEVELYFKFLEQIMGQDNAQLIFVDKNIDAIVPADLTIDADLEITVKGILHKLQIETPSIDLQTILKSNAVLILYNLIESTVENCMKAIHDALNKASIPYLQASVPIQKLWLYFKEKQISKKDNNNYLNDIYGMIEVLVKAEKIEMPYKGEFSGNMGPEAMDKLAKSYGFAPVIADDQTSKQIDAIRFNRNKLAHGELSFREWGHKNHIIFLIKLKQTTLEYMEQFVKNVDEYLEPAHPKFKR